MTYSCTGSAIKRGMPLGRHRAVGELPSPPWAWAAMLSSCTFRYSRVSRACCAGPHALVGSNLIAWPRRRGLMASHWPFQLGYFASSAAPAPPIVSTSAAANTNAAVELRYDMSIPPLRLSDRLVAIDANIHATMNRIHRRSGAWNDVTGSIPLPPA